MDKHDAIKLREYISAINKSDGNKRKMLIYRYNKLYTLFGL